MHEGQTVPELEKLTKREFVLSVLHGIGGAAGLALLWAMEAVRDRVFRLLDRWHVPSARWRKASASPPGPTRR